MSVITHSYEIAIPQFKLTAFWKKAFAVDIDPENLPNNIPAGIFTIPAAYPANSETVEKLE